MINMGAKLEMRKIVKILVPIFMSGACACTNIHVNRASLVASSVALVCDWGQTRHMAASGWGTHMETNPLLGTKPTVGIVDGYFAATVLINSALWVALPERWRSIIPVAVIGVQAPVIHGNQALGAGVCGI